MEPNGNTLDNYLGFDFSTQQLKVVAVNSRLEVISEAAVNYDTDLPEFRTIGGVNKQADNHTVTACPLMWVKALDMVLERLKITGLDFGTIAAISGGGQQHGSVYWKKGSASLLSSLDPKKFLHHQLHEAFSLRDSPIWMDSSTSEQCRQLEEAVGGPQNLANITGSRAYERFTGSQIAKICKTRNENYSNTERITLVSNFGATLFLGDYAPIDLSDGSGMNLLDIRSQTWSVECLNACGPELVEKLGKPVPSWKILGPISNYFVERYGFCEKCSIVAFTGDNPASLIGLCLKENDIAISLGTSDTAFVWLKEATPTLDGHILINPLNEKEYLGLLCFKNGSKTRERIRNEAANGDWKIFSELLNSTPRGNFNNIGFYFDFKEIYPLKVGDFRFNRFDQPVTSFSKEVEVRACVEGQFLRCRVHAKSLGYKIGPNSKVIATGGASVNRDILQVLADVFNAPVVTHKLANSSCLGSAYVAKYALLKAANNSATFDSMVAHKIDDLVEHSITPADDAGAIYDAMAARYERLEDCINRQ